MSSDSGQRQPGPPRADLSMPNIVDVKIRHTTFSRRSLRNFKSALPESDDAVELIIETDRPIPIRNLGPALYIGDTPVTEVAEVGPNTYRFVAPARERLKEDAVISLTWAGKGPGAEADSAKESATESKVFRYRLESEPMA